jgi:hypothetical protein
MTLLVYDITSMLRVGRVSMPHLVMIIGEAGKLFVDIKISRHDHITFRRVTVRQP